MILSEDILQAVAYLADGKIIAYPTEGVYGLGCDPFNEQAVKQLLAVKQRSITKGLILIASSYDQIKQLTLPLSKDQLRTLAAKTPVTWLLPASKEAPSWITGNSNGIAIRLTKFPLARRLCEAFKKPIVSTSANKSGQPAAKTLDEVLSYFSEEVDFILKGEVGDLNKPTALRDLITGAILRE